MINRVQLITAVVVTCLVTNAEANDDVLTAPGPQLDAVEAFLNEIAEGFEKNNSAFATMRATGVYAFHQTIDPDEEEPAPDAQEIPDENWLPFELIQRSDLRRFEVDYFYKQGGIRNRATAHRLMSVDGFYKLDQRMLYIADLSNIEESWADLISGPIQMEQAFDGNQYQIVPNTCRGLIEKLTGRDRKRPWDSKFHRLRCLRQGSLLSVEQVETDAVPTDRGGYRFSFTVDASKGYRLVRSRRHAGGPGRGLNYTEASEFDVREVAPDAYFAMSGTTDVASRGSSDRRPGTIHRAYRIDTIHVGDFEYDDERFLWSSLPIPLGTQIEDRRVDPPLESTFRGFDDR